MTGMNVWKRATLAIVRKPVRSGIIGLLMLMVFTSLVAQVGASTALQKMSDDIGGSLGIGFTVDTGENPVSPKEASRFSRIPGVGKTVYERKTLAQVDGAHPVVPEHGPRLDSGLSTQVSVLGTTDSSLSEEFQSGLYRLEQGRHISGDLPTQSGRPRFHRSRGRNLLWQCTGTEPYAIGRIGESHLFGRSSGFRADWRGTGRHDPVPLG